MRTRPQREGRRSKTGPRVLRPVLLLARSRGCRRDRGLKRKTWAASRLRRPSKAFLRRSGGADRTRSRCRSPPAVSLMEYSPEYAPRSGTLAPARFRIASRTRVFAVVSSRQPVSPSAPMVALLLAVRRRACADVGSSPTSREGSPSEKQIANLAEAYGSISRLVHASAGSFE